MRRSPTRTKVSSKVSLTAQVRYLCYVMRQAESSRNRVQRRNNSCLRDAFVFFLAYCGMGRASPSRLNTPLIPTSARTLHVETPRFASTDEEAIWCNRC